MIDENKHNRGSLPIEFIILIIVFVVGLTIFLAIYTKGFHDFGKIANLFGSSFGNTIPGG